MPVSLSELCGGRPDRHDKGRGLFTKSRLCIRQQRFLIRAFMVLRGYLVELHVAQMFSNVPAENFFKNREGR
jgi:hypothetical protein